MRICVESRHYQFLMHSAFPFIVLFSCMSLSGTYVIRKTVFFNCGGISFASKKTYNTRATNFCVVLHSSVQHFKRHSSNANSVLQGTSVHIYRPSFIGYTFNRKYSDFILPCYHCLIKHVLHILRRSYPFHFSLKFIH